MITFKWKNSVAFAIFFFERYVVLSAVNIDVSFSLLLTHMKLCTIVFPGRTQGEVAENFPLENVLRGEIGQNNSLLYLLFSENFRWANIF